MKDATINKPLTILMTTDTVGGVWTYSVELCKSLQPFNVHFHLITTGAPIQAAQKAEIARLANVTVYETDFLLEWMQSPWQSIDESAAWLVQLAEEIQPDLVHLNCFVYGSLPWKVPVVMVAHSDVFSWWLAVKESYPPIEWNEYFRRVYKGLQGADLLIAPSNALLKDIQKIYLPGAPCKVIYNGISSTRFYPGTKQPVVSSIGRIWDEAKNIRLLVEASKNVPYQVRLAGDTSFKNGSFDATGANIVHLGKLSSASIARELSKAAVYALPAKYEPFGLSVLEAALSGCALVLGDIASLKEIWGDCALYVDPHNAAELARTISHLFENEKLRLQYAQKAMQRAKKYRGAAMAKNYLRVYSGLLKSKSSLVETINMI